MKKGEIKKKVRQAILKENQLHQQLFEELKTGHAGFDRFIAKELSAVPSVRIRQKYRWLIFLFLGLVLYLMLFRIGSLYSIFAIKNSIWLQFFSLTFLLFIPILSIYAALTYRFDLLRGMGVFYGFTIFRSGVFYVTIRLPEDLFYFIPLIAIIFLTWYIPKKMKTPKTIKAQYQQNPNTGKRKMIIDVHFHDDIIMDDQIFDNDLE